MGDKRSNTSEGDLERRKKAKTDTHIRDLDAVSRSGQSTPADVLAVLSQLLEDGVIEMIGGGTLAKGGKFRPTAKHLAREAAEAAAAAAAATEEAKAAAAKAAAATAEAKAATAKAAAAAAAAAEAAAAAAAAAAAPPLQNET
jgi:hypothetical protein